MVRVTIPSGQALHSERQWQTRMEAWTDGQCAILSLAGSQNLCQTISELCWGDQGGVRMVLIPMGAKSMTKNALHFLFIIAHEQIQSNSVSE